VSRNYRHIPVTSATLPVDPSARYADFPHFVAFGERIKFAGGVNKPKIVTATDSEGHQWRQLVGWVCVLRVRKPGAGKEAVEAQSGRAG
jgi:hypothetical protein